MKFKIGDVVVLKSGGPQMTVTGSSEGDRALCSWFIDGAQSKGAFHEDALELAGKS